MGDTSGECIGTNAGINSPGEGVTRLAQLWDFVCLLGSARRSSYRYLFHHQPLIIGIVRLNDDGYFQNAVSFGLQGMQLLRRGVLVLVVGSSVVHSYGVVRGGSQHTA